MTGVIARWLWLAVFSAVAVTASAHDSRPLYVELLESQQDLYQLRWKAPPSLPSAKAPQLVMPVSCLREGGIAEMRSPAGTARRAMYRCEDDLSGQILAIRYPDANPSLSTLVRYQRLSGQQHTTILGPGENHWIVPDAETPSRVAFFYTWMGAEHIWAGIDHLLFLVCLLWIAGSWRRILVTVTGFTLAHSVTLVLSALQWVSLPIAPVEAVIALSILFLVREILRGRRVSLTWRYPVLVSSSFGLLHGFGFANALTEVGLPQTEVPLALLFFNLGVEIGQLIFVAAILAIGALAARILRGFEQGGSAEWRQGMGVAVLYGVGLMSSFWLMERLHAFV